VIQNATMTSAVREPALIRSRSALQSIIVYWQGRRSSDSRGKSVKKILSVVQTTVTRRSAQRHLEHSKKPPVDCSLV